MGEAEDQLKLDAVHEVVIRLVHLAGQTMLVCLPFFSEIQGTWLRPRPDILLYVGASNANALQSGRRTGRGRSEI